MEQFKKKYSLCIIISLSLLLSSCSVRPDIRPLESSTSIEHSIPTPSLTQEPEPEAEDEAFNPAIVDSEIIMDIDAWSHPVKEVIERSYMELLKVELTRNKEYPIFYVELSKSSKFFNKLNIEAAVKSIAKANSYWSFSLIDEEKKLQIDVKCNSIDKNMLTSTINGQDNYFLDKFKASDVIWQKQPPALQKLLLEINQYGWNIKKMLEERDLDHDGNKEFVVEFADLEDEFAELDSYLIRKTNKGYESIERISDSRIYDLEWLDYKARGQTFLYAAESNDFSVSGFSMFKLTTDGLVEVAEGYGASGYHSNSWVEEQADGKLRKYFTQGYNDIQGHTITWVDLWDSSKFISEKAIISYQDSSLDFVYPTDPMNVVDNYLADHYLLNMVKGEIKVVDKRILSKEINEMIVAGLKDSRDYADLDLANMMYYTTELYKIKIIDQSDHIVLQVYKSDQIDSDNVEADSPSLFFTLDMLDSKWKIAKISDTLPVQ